MLVEKFVSLKNSFLIVEGVKGVDYPALAQRLCNVKCGIGADGLIVLKKSKNLVMRFFNADGSRADTCGNGLRCVGCRCALQNPNVKSVAIDCNGVTRRVVVKSTNPFVGQVALGRAEFFAGQTKTDEPVLSVLNVDGKKVFLFKTKLGVPHAILIDQAENLLLAQKICRHPFFVGGTNVDFVSVKNAKEIFVKTFERGVGWTESCGTGMGACVAVCCATNRCISKVKASSKGGVAVVESTEQGVFVTGQARRIFVGAVED